MEPDYPESEEFFESNLDRLERKWGGRAAFQAQKHRHQLKERGEEVGIKNFNLRRIASNTMASHRLVQWVARLKGLEASEKLYDYLNEQHFLHGRKLNDRVLLMEAVVEAGCDAGEALAFLSSDTGRTEILNTVRLVQASGIHGIPYFIFDGGSYTLSGAARAAEIAKVLRALENDVFKGNVMRPPAIFKAALQG